jgi:hypothetical protein
MKKIFPQNIFYYIIAVTVLISSLAGFGTASRAVQKNLHYCIRQKGGNFLCDKDAVILNSLFVFVSMYALLLGIEFRPLFLEIKKKVNKEKPQ